MPSYLNVYGAEDARREKIFKRIIIVAVITAITVGLFYWKFKDFREERQIKAFIGLVENSDYRAAYALWGCTESQPCTEYPYEKFLRDWGPDGEFGNISRANLPPFICERCLRFQNTVMFYCG